MSTVISTSNIKAKKISELNELSETGIYENLNYLYLPAACVESDNSHTNYKIPLKIIFDKLDYITNGYIQQIIRNNIKEILINNIDKSWHKIDYGTVNEIALGIDEEGKIILKLSKGIAPTPDRKEYSIILRINGPIESNMEPISIWDEKNNSFFTEIDLSSNEVKIDDIEEGTIIKLNLYTYLLNILNKYANEKHNVIIKDIANGEEHTIELDNENITAESNSIVVLKDTNVEINVYRSISVTTDMPEGIKTLTINGIPMSYQTIDSHVLKYGDSIEVKCELNDNYYLRNSNAKTLTFDDCDCRFDIMKKPYVNFHVLAINNNYYNGTSICTIMPNEIIDTVKNLEQYYDKNTELDDIINIDIKEILKRGGFYTLHHPLYYLHTDNHNNPQSIQYISENSFVDIVLKQNTSVVKIQVIDTNNIYTNYELPLTKTINYETLYSDSWTNPDITCDLIDINSYTYKIVYKNINGTNAEYILKEIIDITEDNGHLLIKFKDKFSYEANYAAFCLNNAEYTIEIQTQIIDKYVYYAGWELPSSILQLYNLAKDGNGENISSKKSDPSGTIIRSFDGELTHPRDNWYIIIPEWVGIYGPDAINTVEDTFDEPDTTSLHGYKIFTKKGSTISGYVLKKK